VCKLPRVICRSRLVVASSCAAERIDPIELVIDDPQGERERMTGRLRPPHRRHARLREMEFGLRERTG